MDLTKPLLAAPVAASIYPAIVRQPGGAIAFQKVRVVITPEWLVVYGERNDGGKRSVKTVAKVAHTGMRPDPKRSGAWVVDGTDGEWVVDRGSGCGCNSPLRHMPSPSPLDL